MASTTKCFSPRLRSGAAACAMGLALAGPLPVQADGLNAMGTAGGLTIPTARTLGNGTVAMGLGNAREPQIPGRHSRNASFLLGVGLLPGVDIVGRLAENITRDPSGYGGEGISDLSANVKFGFPLSEDKDALRLGAGMNDITGGAVNFSAKYLVATKPFGPWEITLGYGRSDAVAKPGTHRALDGPFGGASFRLLDDVRWGQLQLMAEHDARQPSLGANWISPPVNSLGRLQVHAGVYRSFEREAMPAATAVRLSLNFPVGENEDRLSTHPAPPKPAPSAPPAARDTPTARLSRLKDELVALGLEKLRVGRLGDGSWVIEYQNYRFAHHELDAMGVVVGKAARAAPAEVRDIVVRALKTGQPVLTLRTRAAVWREFLDGGPTEAVQAVTTAQRGDGLARTAVDWISETSSPGSWAQIQLLPRLGYTLGTEYGAFDYAAALRMEAAIPLWRGGQIIVNAQKRVLNSDRADPGQVFEGIRPPEGLRALALHQSLWWGEHVLFGVAVGRFENGAKGVESETHLFVPGRDDVIRVRGRLLELLPQMPLGADAQQWVSYRWVVNPRTTLEGGWQRYGDRSAGPMLTYSRWWGDLGVHLTYRKGGIRQYGGLEISIPLGPALSPALAGKIHVAGAPQWRTGLRTRITDKYTAGNWVEPGKVPEYAPAWDMESRILNGARFGPRYTQEHLSRLRSAHGVWSGER